MLYRLPELQGQADVIIVEGEKDADNLVARGLVATTNVSGAGKWKAEYTEQLVAAKVARVAIIGDNDIPGQAHATAIARACVAHGLDVKLVRLPGLPPVREKHGEDVSDWLELNSVDELQAVILATAPFSAEAAEDGLEPRISIRSIGDSLARASGELVVRYAVHPYIPVRGLIAVSGGPGVGKGKFAQDLMLARASAQRFLGQDVVPGPSLFWSGEQGMDEDDRVFQAFARGRDIVPAAITHPLFVLSDPPSQIDHPTMRAQVFDLARQHPGLLVVLDSIRRAFPGDEIISETPDRFFRDIFVPLRTLGATVLFLAHPPKPPAQGELRPDSLLRGSGDWLAILDSFLVLKAAGRQRLDHRTEDIHSTLLHVKARRGPRADEGTLTLHVTNDETPDLCFAFSFTPGGTEVTKAQVAIEALAAFYRERGRAGRRDYLNAFKDRFSERQLDPARKMLVAQGLLKEVDGGAGRASVWGWVGGNTGVNAIPLFEQESLDAVL